jgi:hypothetical protein
MKVQGILQAARFVFGSYSILVCIPILILADTT